MTCPAVLFSYSRMVYADAWALQRTLVHERIENRCPDTFVLLEHEPVFTVGRRGQESHYQEIDLLNGGYPLYHVERGGSVTYHGPGQIVGYPILRLDRYCAGPKAYIWLLEEVVIQTLLEWNIIGKRIENMVGVWVGQEKIAAMGVRIVRGVTMHGFSLNATVDLAPFARIVPCGIAGCRVTSMAQVLGHHVDVAAVRRAIVRIFADVLGVQWRMDCGYLESVESLSGDITRCS